MIGIKNIASKDITTKAYLKNSDGFCFPLTMRQTSIGRECCDILIQMTTVDPQHAMVEFNDAEDCYVLTDLNTINGTFVNDVRVHNAAVRLAPRDSIRFGAKGPPYEFYIHSRAQITNGRGSPFQRSAWGQQIKLGHNHQSPPFLASTVPQLSSTHFHSTQDQPDAIMAWSPSVTGTVFTSQVGNNGVSSGVSIAANMNSTNVTTFGQTPQPPDQMQTATNSHSQRINWEKTPSAPPLYAASPPVSQTKNWDSNFLTPSKTCGNGNSHQLNRSYTIFPANENVFDKKDEKIASLTNEVNHLKSLEEELQQEQERRSQLEEKLKQMQSVQSDISNDQLKSKIDDKTNQLISLQSEFDKVNKDKNITIGLVTQMQKDLSNKDSTISRLTREVENLKRNVWEKESSVELLTTKMSKMKDGIKSLEENELREKELQNLHQKLKMSEAKQKQQVEFVESQNGEINKLKQTLSEERDEKRKLQSDLGQVRFELDDITRAERLVRIDMEQIAKKMERFHNRVLQVAFSLPGKSSPQKEINDDELIEILQKMAQTENKVNEMVKMTEVKIQEVEQRNEELIKKSNQLNSPVSQLLARLDSNGLRCDTLKKEMELFESVSVEEPFVWLKKCFLKLLKTELNWQQKIEKSLEKCGINIKVSTSEPSHHIEWLQNKWSVALEENEQLKKRITKSDENHKSEMKIALDSKEKETLGRIKEVEEKTILQGKENLAKAMEEIKNIEAEKQAAAVNKEKEKIEDLSLTVDSLKKLINEKDKETADKLEEANKVLTEMEELKVAKSNLEEKLQKADDELGFQAEQNKLALQTENNNREKEILTYKEQIKQHSITICSLEEKLAKTTKVHKESMDQIVTLEKKLHESRTQIPVKQSPPPKPKVIVQNTPPDLQSRDQLIAVLRKETLELKQQLQEKEEVIIGLRKDLLGTSARLSDIKGELSEESKKKVEYSKSSINRQQKEMNDLRQKLAALSQVIEEKTQRIKRLQSDLEREKASSITSKKNNQDLSEKIALLERFLQQEKQDRHKIDQFNDRENQQTSELANLGAQCRGERHEQVINRQRTALAELRQKIKTIEQNKFHGGFSSGVDASKPSLKHRAKSLSDRNEFYRFDRNNSANLSLPINVKENMGSNPEAEIERSAHKETADALEASEISFLYMLRQLLAALEVEDHSGLRSLAHMPSDERAQILQARKRTCENLVKEIQLQQERLGQKERLFKNYEEDLAKMRKAEDLACRKSGESDLLAKDLVSKTEETELLRETLNRTTSQLQQEKRLNNAIKQKKTFHLENERAHIGVQATPHFCLQNRSISKLAAGGRNMSRGIVNPYLKVPRKEMLKKGRMDRKSFHSDTGRFPSALRPSQPEKP